MDREIKVEVKDKVATAPPDAVIVCGNSDYTILFQFDEEWDGLEVKTARFKYSTYAGPKQHIDVPFTGNMVEVPILTNAHKVEVGVYAGNLTTTTGAHIRCLPSIRCGSGERVEPSPDKYDALMDLIKGLTGEVTGVTNHADLEGREAADQHPIASIEGLQAILDACRKSDKMISAEEIGYSNEALADRSGNIKGALDEAVAYVVSELPDLVASKHSHNNKDVLDGLGEDSAGSLTYRGRLVGGDNNLHVVERNLDDVEACARVYTPYVMTIEADLPENARVKKIEYIDAENGTEEYMLLDDMTNLDPIGSEAPYFFTYPRNKFGTMLPIAAHISFPLQITNEFYDRAHGYNLTGRLRLHYEIEE
jgi:hypothetical protein